jgi:gluconolactonase
MEWELHPESSTSLVFYAAPLQDRRGETAMMYLETPPKLIATKVFTSMPDQFRRKGVATEWADANRPDQPTDCFCSGLFRGFRRRGSCYDNALHS